MRSARPRTADAESCRTSHLHPRRAARRAARYAAPLIAGGVRCHGGFEADGRYRSPRTLHRAPAIAAWQARLAREGAPLIEIPRALMPPQYPNVAQSTLLLRHGVRDPIVRTLTIISIVEGFGAIIRDVKVPDLGALVVEPVEGTALAHLAQGLFEAHARDESGFRDEGGHKQMWEAARDLALEKPKIPGDVLMRMMGRNAGRGKRPERPFPQLDETLERMLALMAQVLVVEVFAEGTFEWGVRAALEPRGVGRARGRGQHGALRAGPTRSRTSSTCAPRSPSCARARCARSTARRSRAARSWTGCCTASCARSRATGRASSARTSARA